MTGTITTEGVFSDNHNHPSRWSNTQWPASGSDCDVGVGGVATGSASAGGSARAVSPAAAGMSNSSGCCSGALVAMSPGATAADGADCESSATATIASAWLSADSTAGGGCAALDGLGTATRCAGFTTGLARASIFRACGVSGESVRINDPTIPKKSPRPNNNSPQMIAVARLIQNTTVRFSPAHGKMVEPRPNGNPAFRPGTGGRSAQTA